MRFPIIEDTYQFNCTRCGNCCTGEQRINLNPYDLYKMARYKGYDHTAKLFDNNIVHLVQSQHQAWIPQIKFKSIAKKGHQFCPFLINELDESNKLLGLCSLHPAKKPLICAMAPVGRSIDFNNDSEEYIYVKPAPDCPGVDIKKENTLSDLKQLLKIELKYEKQFLKILDHITEKNLSKEFYLNHLYLFPTNLNLSDIFDNMGMK